MRLSRRHAFSCVWEVSQNGYAQRRSKYCWRFQLFLVLSVLLRKSERFYFKQLQTADAVVACVPCIQILICLCSLCLAVQGMLFLGYVGDLIGRKWGSVLTASLMTLGALLLVASDGTTVRRGSVLFISPAKANSSNVSSLSIQQAVTTHIDEAVLIDCIDAEFWRTSNVVDLQNMGWWWLCVLLLSGI